MNGRSRMVLVTAASRHGATGEIAAALARTIETSGTGLSAMNLPVGQRPDPTPFAAVVLGSAVYAGRWLEPAREYAAAHAGALRERPVWLFSSGPIGEPPFPPDDPYDLAALSELTAARGHAVFAGRLDKDRLTFGERAMVTAMRAPLGDFRDWDAIRAWGRRIADHVAAAGAIEQSGRAAAPPA
jgi:menaquinone-dependent protoporphyrinogen oxidase